MSESTRYFKEITARDRAENGVVSLAIRPNMPSQYGEGSLSGKQLQQRFDRLATLIIERYNEMAKALSSKEVLEYFKLPNETTLADFIEKITDDAYDIVSTNPYDKGNEAKLSTIIQKLFSGIEALATFTEYDENKAQKISEIYATIAALENEASARQKSDATLENIISNAIESLRTDISTAVTKHNDADDNHEDIRRDLATVLAFLSSDSGNDTIDRLHELIAEIEKNAGSIDEITKNKVSKDDIVNTFSDLESATNSNIPGAKLLYDYFATKEALADFITSTTLTEALTAALLPYAKNIRLGGSLKYFITTYQHSQSDINGWIDKTDTWNIPNEQSVEGVESGDLLLFRCFNTTTNLYSYVFATAVETYPDTNKIVALSTSVIHAGASTSSGGIDASSIVTNLDDPSTDKVLAASVGALIKERIEEAVKGLLSKNELEKALEGYATDDELETAVGDMLTKKDLDLALEDVAKKEEIQGLVKSTDLDKTLSNYALTTEVHTIAKDKIQEALETFDPGFNLPEAAMDIFAEAFLTNGSFGLKYGLEDENAKCLGIGRCTNTDIVIGSIVKGLPVVGIYQDAFADNDRIHSTYIPKSIETVETNAFLNCTNLIDVYYHGDEQQWKDMFIGDGNEHFSNAVSFYLSSGNPLPTWQYFNRYWRYDDNQTIQEVLNHTEGLTMVQNSNGTWGVSGIGTNTSATLIKIPYKHNGGLVTNINNNAFLSNRNLSICIIPNSVESIGISAFSGCNKLSRLIIGKGVKTIGTGSFASPTSGSANKLFVYYVGTQEEWNRINIEPNNARLSGAMFQFEVTPADLPDLLEGDE